ncbi:MAG: hypothetical protein IJY31_07280 [Muribaculaceae bacterium]|nr:hypothetical protein [Muribaculaceae bacterium]
MVRRMVLCAIVAVISVVVSPAQFIANDNKSSHFAWGADVGGAIDMSGNDMSAINLDAYFGYKNPFVKIAGVGAGIDMMVSNSSRMFPVYGIFQSGFRNTPTLCFLDVRAGLSFNNLVANESQSDFYGSLGVGFNLAEGRNFRSYVILSYNYVGLDSYTAYGYYYHLRDLHSANIRIGISF